MLSKTIENYVKSNLPEYSFKIKEYKNDIFLLLVIDTPKIDPNTNEFDENFYNSLNPKLSGIQSFLYDPLYKLKNLFSEIKTWFGVNTLASFTFENYEYLGEFEDMIQKALDELTDKFGDVKIEIKLEGGDPKIQLLFFMPLDIDMNGFKEIFKPALLNKLEELFNKKFDFSKYKVSFTKRVKNQ